MTSWVDIKYINLLSYQLENFKKVGSNYNFRCILCGDSKQSKSKTRGWFLTKQDSVSFYCHNCGASLPFGTFLEKINYGMYREYLTEKFAKTKSEEPIVDMFAFSSKPKFEKNPLKELTKISELADDHPAKKYILSRNIPSSYLDDLYYCAEFKKWTNSIVPNKFEDFKWDEARIIIPFLDENKRLFGFQGRSLNPKAIKYVTIMLDETKKIYGLDRVDTNQRRYVFEGPIDSMFIDNALASAGSKIEANLSPHDDYVIVYDNEPRSKETIAKMTSAIDSGFKVCIWPDYIREKDINDMVLSGKTPSDIKKIIDDNSFKSIRAKMALTKWKKV